MFKIVPEQEKENFARFSIEPLEVGFGHTVGNSLRRVLLNNLPGSAIVALKIDGVSHQFSTIDGVIEDVIQVILNLKKVRVRVHSDKPIRLVLKIVGKKEVKAKDIEVVGDGEIANPDQYIATISDAKGKLNIEMSATQGKGYSKAEERKTDEIGTMAIDALFSPIVSVNYSVEPTRVGRKTDLDRLIIEIVTDGTISPRDALDQSAVILNNTFKQIYEPVTIDEEDSSGAQSVSDEVLKLTIDELDLPVRITNALRAMDIITVDNLVNVSRLQLLKAKNLGSKSLSLISEKLAERGLSLSEA